MTEGRIIIQSFPRVLIVEPHRIILSQTSFSIQRSVKLQNSTALSINSLSYSKRSALISCLHWRRIIIKLHLKYIYCFLCLVVLFPDYLLILKLLARRNNQTFVQRKIENWILSIFVLLNSMRYTGLSKTVYLQPMSSAG